VDASLPVACTLTDDQGVERLKAWHELLDGRVERVRVPGGIQLRPQADAAVALLELIDLERECCAWINYEVGEDSVVTLTAAGEAEATLVGMFLSTSP
jgi:hypothetical protein